MEAPGPTERERSVKARDRPKDPSRAWSLEPHAEVGFVEEIDKGDLFKGSNLFKLLNLLRA